jgi:hypothetical protein
MIMKVVTRSSKVQPPAGPSEDAHARIRAFVASMVPSNPLSREAERGRSLIEQIALSTEGADHHPSIRLAPDQCADVLSFIASVEPRTPDNWWDSPQDSPCHVTGMTLVLWTLVDSLRKERPL